MAIMGSSCRWAAWTLVIALGACGENITTSTSSKPAANLSDVAAVPGTLVITTEFGWHDIHTPPGFVLPAGKAYSIVLKGENWPLSLVGNAFFSGIFSEGQEIFLGGGSGRAPDGSYGLVYSGGCPSRMREVYGYITANGKKYESKRIVPVC